MHACLLHQIRACPGKIGSKNRGTLGKLGVGQAVIKLQCDANVTLHPV